MRLRFRLQVFSLSCSIAVLTSAAQQPLSAPNIAHPAVATGEKAQLAEGRLPDLASLIARAKQNADAMAELRKNYICKETVVADDFDSKGNKKGTHTDEFQVFYVNNVEIRQHTSRDGKPLPDADQKKEQGRVDKLVSEIKANKHKSRDDGITLHASSLLKLATVGVPRREIVDGRSTILFDYTGNSKAKADGPAEEVMKKLTGTLALDEKDAAIVRMTGTLRENFKLMGGLLVNIKQGSHFEIEATRVNGEIWFTKSVNAHVDGRVLIFKGFDGNAHVTFSDYRRMRTSVTLLPGSQVIGEDGKPVVEPEPAPISPPKPPQ